MTDTWEHAADNSRKCYDLAISERLLILPSAALGLHVARLAEANQVFSCIGSFSGGELAEWDDVVDRQRSPYRLCAGAAAPVLIGHNLSPDLQPSSAAVRGNAAHKTRGLFGPEGPGGLEASPTAKTRWPVLAREPRLLTELASTVFACAFYAIHPRWRVLAANAGLKCIGWWHPSTKPVALHVRLRTFIQGFASTERPGALKRAKTRAAYAVRLHQILAATFFAVQDIGHAKHIVRVCSGSMGSGTTDIACRRIEDAYKQPDLFVHHQRPPVAEQVDWLAEAK